MSDTLGSVCTYTETLQLLSRAFTSSYDALTFRHTALQCSSLPHRHSNVLTSPRIFHFPTGLFNHAPYTLQMVRMASIYSIDDTYGVHIYCRRYVWRPYTLQMVLWRPYSVQTVLMASNQQFIVNTFIYIPLSFPTLPTAHNAKCYNHYRTFRF